MYAPPLDPDRGHHTDGVGAAPARHPLLERQRRHRHVRGAVAPAQGDFKNAGRDWRPQGQPKQVRVHGFIDDESDKVAPYRLYDVTANVGWVNQGQG